MSLQIEDMMAKKIVTVQEDTSLKQVISKMNEHEREVACS